VRLLPDTRAFLWWSLDDPTLHRDADEAVASADVVYVSLASAWEMAIKQGIGRLDLGEQAEKAILDSGFDPLPIPSAMSRRWRDSRRITRIRSIAC
jgi:PIN domain nuclease of toxin-antitoxin system